MEKPWWQHWYVAAVAIPVALGLLVLAIMAIQRLSVGSSSFYVATVEAAAAMPVVVSYTGNDLQVDMIQHAEVPFFGGDMLLVLVVKGSRGQVRLVAQGHADAENHPEFKRFTLETLRGEKVNLLSRHVNGL